MQETRIFLQYPRQYAYVEDEKEILIQKYENFSFIIKK